jgi:predicted transcriptional regulator
MAVDNSNGKKETYCAYKNCKDINVAVKSREVPRTDWPTYLAELRKMFGNNFSIPVKI